MLLLRPTMVDVEVRLGSGDGEVEAAGVLRTAIIWVEDGELSTVLRSEADLRVILWKKVGEGGRRGRIYRIEGVASDVIKEKRRAGCRRGEEEGGWTDIDDGVVPQICRGINRLAN